MDNNACYSKYGSYDDCVVMIGGKTQFVCPKKAYLNPWGTGVGGDVKEWISVMHRSKAPTHNLGTKDCKYDQMDRER